MNHENLPLFSKSSSLYVFGRKKHGPNTTAKLYTDILFIYSWATIPSKKKQQIKTKTARFTSPIFSMHPFMKDSVCSGIPSSLYDTISSYSSQLNKGVFRLLNIFLRHPKLMMILIPATTSKSSNLRMNEYGSDSQIIESYKVSRISTLQDFRMMPYFCSCQGLEYIVPIRVWINLGILCSFSSYYSIFLPYSQFLIMGGASMLMDQSIGLIVQVSQPIFVHPRDILLQFYISWMLKQRRQVLGNMLCFFLKETIESTKLELGVYFGRFPTIYDIQSFEFDQIFSREKLHITSKAIIKFD